MPGADQNYELFKKAYATQNFPFAGRLIYQIVSTLPGLNELPKEEWQDKFSQLLQFLHRTTFSFEHPDTFYEILAIIAVRLRRNQQIDWRVILD